jgi:hypothetical protein
MVHDSVSVLKCFFIWFYIFIFDYDLSISFLNLRSHLSEYVNPKISDSPVHNNSHTNRDDHEDFEADEKVLYLITG